VKQRLMSLLLRRTIVARRHYAVGQNLNLAEVVQLRTLTHANKPLREVFGEQSKVVVLASSVRSPQHVKTAP